MSGERRAGSGAPWRPPPAVLPSRTGPPEGPHLLEKLLQVVAAQRIKQAGLQRRRRAPHRRAQHRRAVHPQQQVQALRQGRRG